MVKHRTAPRNASKLASKHTLDALPDRIDLRDWPYQPTLAALPDTLVNCSKVPIILDQGNEGACTGFALSAVVNYLLAQRGITSASATQTTCPTSTAISI